MKGEGANDGETRGENTSMGYLQRVLGATLIIWLSLFVVIIAAFGLSESLRVAGVERNENLLITFFVSLGLILLDLWLLPRSFLTLKEEQQDDVRQTYIQHIPQSLSVMWAALAVVMIVAIGLY